jgi:hypothetical protein
VIDERPAPAHHLPTEDAAAIIEAFTASQRRAIALTLHDLRGWATLQGKVLRFDTRTGEALQPAAKLIGWFDRTPRHGLPDDWPELFIQLGWLEIALDGACWTATAAGRDVRESWLPEHLQGQL